jgi:hypothetical protein
MLISRRQVTMRSPLMEHQTCDSSLEEGQSSDGCGWAFEDVASAASLSTSYLDFFPPVATLTGLLPRFLGGRFKN